VSGHRGGELLGRWPPFREARRNAARRPFSAAASCGLCPRPTASLGFEPTDSCGGFRLPPLERLAGLSGVHYWRLTGGMRVQPVRLMASLSGRLIMIRAKHFGDEQNRVWQILACPGARMNPELAETLAYNSTVSASVAIGVLAHTIEARRGPLPSVTQSVPLVTRGASLNSLGLFLSIHYC
jgi:hypothetical protein